jgi:DNA-binding NarL/FixJ family response regulator
MTRVVLVDDHPIVRTGIAALLSDEEDLEVVGQAHDGLQALELVAALHPDVLLLDLMLPGLSGIEVNRRVVTGFPGTKVLVLTLHANEAYAAQVLSDGATGFVLKDAEPAEILLAVRDVAAGRAHYPARMRDARWGANAVDPWSTLSDREREVAQLCAEGLSHVDAGLRLGISPRTVEVHRGNAMRKLQLEGTAELVRYLMRRGILSATE